MRFLFIILFPFLSFAQTKHTYNPYGNVNGANYELEEDDYQARSITYSPASTVWAPGYGWPQTEVAPGDTIELNATYYFGRFYIIGVSGTPGQRVIVTSSDTTLNVLDKGITFIDCEYINVIGLRQKTRTTRGIAYEVLGRSRNITFTRCHSDSSWYHTTAKQDPVCDTMYNYPNWVMDSIQFFHNLAYDGLQDPFYLGNTSQIPGERTITCDAEVKEYLPMAISNYEVAYCTVIHGGRTAIQIAGHRSGTAKIHHNLIRGMGYELDQSQGVGILIGGMSRNVYVYDNTIRQTFTFGILEMGVDSNYIERNNVDSTGIFYLGTEARQIFDEISWRNEDSLLAVQPDIFRVSESGYIFNIWDGTENGVNSGDSSMASIALFNRVTFPVATKTSFVRNNIVGRNTGFEDSDGSISFRQYGVSTDWTAFSVVCSNTKQIGGDAGVFPDYGSGTFAVTMNTTACPLATRYFKRFQLNGLQRWIH